MFMQQLTNYIIYNDATTHHYNTLMMEKYYLKGCKSGSFTLFVHLFEGNIHIEHPRCGFPEYFSQL
jgi:hypothetical protein